MKNIKLISKLSKILIAFTIFISSNSIARELDILGIKPGDNAQTAVDKLNNQIPNLETTISGGRYEIKPGNITEIFTGFTLHNDKICKDYGIENKVDCNKIKILTNQGVNNEIVAIERYIVFNTQPTSDSVINQLSEKYSNYKYSFLNKAPIDGRVMNYFYLWNDDNKINGDSSRDFFFKFNKTTNFDSYFDIRSFSSNAYIRKFKYPNDGIFLYCDMNPVLKNDKLIHSMTVRLIDSYKFNKYVDFIDKLLSDEETKSNEAIINKGNNVKINL